MTTIRRSFVRLASACLLLAACGGDPATDGQNQKIGTACTASAQCGSNIHFFCDKDHPNGYCKRDCTVDADCPPEAICAHDGAVGECHRRCDSVADCRASEGYVCAPASATGSMTASHSFCDVGEAPGGDDGGATASDAGPLPDGGATGG